MGRLAEKLETAPCGARYTERRRREFRDAFEADVDSMAQKVIAHQRDSFEHSSRVVKCARLAIIVIGLLAICMTISLAVMTAREIVRAGRAWTPGEVASRTMLPGSRLTVVSREAKPEEPSCSVTVSARTPEKVSDGSRGRSASRAAGGMRGARWLRRIWLAHQEGITVPHVRNAPAIAVRPGLTAVTCELRQRVTEARGDVRRHRE